MRNTLQNPRNRRTVIALGLVVFLGLVWLAGSEIIRRYHPHYNSLTGWRPISGRWSSQANVLSNSNYGRGDMLIAEHSNRGDYSIAADVRFDIVFSETHYGDAGLVIRATDPEPGVDSYMGYYAGLRLNDQALILGRADYGWRELTTKKLATLVRTGAWYRIELTAQGCNLTATVAPVEGGPSTRIDYQDEHCLTRGVAGLRSFYAQASWRNVQILAK
jgi:hypothetical protein